MKQFLLLLLAISLPNSMTEKPQTMVNIDDGPIVMSKREAVDKKLDVDIRRLTAQFGRDLKAYISLVDECLFAKAMPSASCNSYEAESEKNEDDVLKSFECLGLNLKAFINGKSIGNCPNETTDKPAIQPMVNIDDGPFGPVSKREVPRATPKVQVRMAFNRLGKNLKSYVKKVHETFQNIQDRHLINIEDTSLPKSKREVRLSATPLQSVNSRKESLLKSYENFEKLLNFNMEAITHENAKNQNRVSDENKDVHEHTDKPAIHSMVNIDDEPRVLSKREAVDVKSDVNIRQLTYRFGLDLKGYISLVDECLLAKAMPSDSCNSFEAESEKYEDEILMSYECLGLNLNAFIDGKSSCDCRNVTHDRHQNLIDNDDTHLQRSKREQQRATPKEQVKRAFHRVGENLELYVDTVHETIQDVQDRHRHLINSDDDDIHLPNSKRGVRLLATPLQSVNTRKGILLKSYAYFETVLSINMKEINLENAKNQNLVSDDDRENKDKENESLVKKENTSLKQEASD